MEEKEEKKIDFVKWFQELNKNSGKTAGGKGANLAEIYNLKIPVPPGFVVTSEAYDYFIEKAGIKDEIKKLLDGIGYEDTSELNKTTEKIRKEIINAEFPEEMKEDILEAYDNLGASKLNVEKGSALDILNYASEPLFVAVRSSATTEDLADASFAGQQDTYVNIKGNNNLLESIKKCFASLFTSRATYYRNKKGFKHEESSIAVVVQKMVDSEKSGVIFSKNPSTDEEDVIIESVFGLGEGIVSGQITPDKYVVSRDLEIKDTKIATKKTAITRTSSGENSKVKLSEEKSKRQVLSSYEIKRLADFALKLEEHFNKPQDIEFAIEGEDIYIVQTRPITTSSKKQEDTGKKIEGEILLEGLAASPGISSGKVKVIEDLSDLSKIKKGDILVTEMTNPDMVVAMQRSSGIITDEGGLTAHAAIVSREMGIPCVVGTGEATQKLEDGQEVTVDGFKGKIHKGATEHEVKKEIKPVEKQTQTNLKVIVDLPSFAERASKTGLKKVGLTRMEGIIAESGKHPEYFLNKGKIREYEEIIFKGINEIAEYFDELWIRTSDIRTDEYKNLEGAPQEVEANPMLGLHGIRYGLKKPEILKAELNALKRVSEKAKIGFLMPQVINVDELKKVKEILKEIEFNNAKVGIMIETPAAVQQIKRFCDEGIDFISFGTNDLTQYMLAIDRGNEGVQDLYDEMHPAILYQLDYVIRVCKRRNVETSICGQAGSKKEMVRFLVDKGIDSITVNADAAKDISELVYKIENNEDIEDEEDSSEIKQQENENQEVSEETREEVIEDIDKTKGVSEETAKKEEELAEKMAEEYSKKEAEQTQEQDLNEKKENNDNQKEANEENKDKLDIFR